VGITGQVVANNTAIVAAAARQTPVLPGAIPGLQATKDDNDSKGKQASAGKINSSPLVTEIYTHLFSTI